MKLTGSQQFEITIDEETGSVAIEANGFTGRGCTDATKELEGLLGSPHDRKKKKEFYQKENAKNKRQIRQGN